MRRHRAERNPDLGRLPSFLRSRVSCVCVVSELALIDRARPARSKRREQWGAAGVAVVAFHPITLL